MRKNHNGNVAIGQGFYFLHSTETCLVGVKYRKGETLEFISKVNNDVIFAEVRERSRKPDQLYQIIERMLPGSRRIELFARNHNIRKGWLSLGNEVLLLPILLCHRLRHASSWVSTTTGTTT